MREEALLQLAASNNIRDLTLRENAVRNAPILHVPSRQKHLHKRTNLALVGPAAWGQNRLLRCHTDDGRSSPGSSLRSERAPSGGLVHGWLDFCVLAAGNLVAISFAGKCR